MDFLQPRSLAEAAQQARARPDAVPIIGGTDVMVDMNFARRRPPALLDLTRVPELDRWEMTGGLLRIGAAVSYTRLITELAGLLPGLAMASRTVGSPQIRNRGTLGGNLGSASPAGDMHPLLLASGAVVEAVSPDGTRQIPIGDFFTGVKRHALRPGELIASVLVPPAPGPQQSRWSSRSPRSAWSWTRQRGGWEPASAPRPQRRVARLPRRRFSRGCSSNGACGNTQAISVTRR